MSAIQYSILPQRVHPGAPIVSLKDSSFALLRRRANQAFMRNFVALKRLAAAIIDFRNEPLSINIIYG